VDGLPINGIPFRRFAGDRTNSFGCRHLLCPLAACGKSQHFGFVTDCNLHELVSLVECEGNSEKTIDGDGDAKAETAAGTDVD
jgi:hypothetical protein